MKTLLANISWFELFISLFVLPSIIVYAHEIGHLAMARVLNVPVIKFSVGRCNNKKWKWSKSFRRGATRYCFAFPFFDRGLVKYVGNSEEIKGNLKFLLITSSGFIAECLAILFFVLTYNYLFALIFAAQTIGYSLGETKAGLVNYFGVASQTHVLTITLKKKLIDINLDIDYEKNKIKLWREVRLISETQSKLIVD